MNLRRAGGNDLAFVMAVERTPTYARFIGKWERARHETVLADPGFATLIGEAGGALRGFAILRGLTGPRPAIQRIAVADAGRGDGPALLGAVLAHAFAALGLATLSLEVFAHNIRARAAYARAGFAPTGFVPDAWTLPDGTAVDDVLMRITAPAWRARQPR